MSMLKSTPSKQEKPTFWCSFLARRPKTVFGITLAWHLLILFATGTLVAVGYDVFPTVFSDMPIQRRFTHYYQFDETFVRNLAWRNRFGTEKNAELEFIHRGQSPHDTRDSNYDYMHIIYKVEGGNVFTRNKLLAMKELEDELVLNPEYIHFCQKKLIPAQSVDGQKDVHTSFAGDAHGSINESSIYGDCVKPTSILRYFDGTYSDVNPIFDDSDFKNIPEVLNMANSMDILKHTLVYHLGVNSKISKNEVFSDVTRTTFHFNKSVDSFRYEDFLLNYDRRLTSIYANDYRGLKVFYYSETIFHTVRNQMVLRDLALVLLGSFSFTFACLYIQTMSLWITSFTILSILASFCGANLIYRVVLNNHYLSAFNAFFIILGLGINHIFVFLDTWKQEIGENPRTLEERLSASFKRAAGSTFFTSITIALSFLVNAFSPLQELHTFGVFTATLVMYNYVSVVTFFPAILVTHHLWWRGRCFSGRNKKMSRAVAQILPPRAPKSLVVKFFGGPYFKFITHNLTRMCSLVIFASLLIWFTFTATCLQTQKSCKVNTFKDSHRFSRFFEEQRFSFSPNEKQETVTVVIVWGLKPQDMSKCHKYDYKCAGTTVYDKNFDLNPAPSQLALLKFCQSLKNLPDEMVNRLHIRRDSSTNGIRVNCFMDSLRTFLQQEEQMEVYENLTASLKLPTSEVKAQTIMNAHPEIFGPMPDNYYRYFEVELAYWLTNRFSGHSTQAESYSGMLGEERDATDTLSTKGGHLYGTRLKFAAISLNTTLILNSLSFDEGIKIKEEWEKFVNEEMAKMPSTVKKGFQLTDGGNDYWGAWHWFEVQKRLADSAMHGITYGLILALPLLIVGTGNLIVGFVATLSIAFTTVCVVGLIPMAGWKLGLLESLNLTIVVGLSVDSVVHLAYAYCRSGYEDRLHRVQDMLERLGPSVISGAVTGFLGPSIILLFAELRLFFQFGVFVLSTTGFSLLFSLVLFAITMGVIGPQKKFGSLNGLCGCAAGQKRRGRGIECTKCSGKGYYSVTSDSTATAEITCCRASQDSKMQFNAINEENIPLTRDCNGGGAPKYQCEWRVTVL